MAELITEKTFISKNIGDLEFIAHEILKCAADKRIISISGEMGAGKTTFIKAICQKIGVKEIVTSPTFAIMNEYKAGQEPVFHFDFYRINTDAEAFDLGYEDFFYSGNYCLVEWPEKIQNLLPLSHVEVAISKFDGVRQIKLSI